MNTLARQITRALGGQWLGTSGMARCPAHLDRVPSLSVSYGEGRRVLVHCHAGCEQKAVVSALRRLGLWPGTNHPPAELNAVAIGYQPQTSVPDSSNCEHASQTWRSAFKPEGTLAERYLRHRGITIPVPASLRFVPHSFHAPTRQRLPAVVAAVHDSAGAISAIQRAFIRNDGSGKAEVAPAKMCLGALGDGAVRLAPAGETVGLCEGWETGLAAMQLYELPIWCSLGASRMRCVVLPPSVRKVVIFADNDAAGREAAERTANVHRCHGRWVEIRWPILGADFNDELMQRANDD